MSNAHGVDLMRHVLGVTTALLTFLLGISAHSVFSALPLLTQELLLERDLKVFQHHINALENGPVGTISLGKASAAPTEDTEYLVSQGEAAVPLLIEVLAREDKPNTVRYAAYCLRRMRSHGGKSVAASVNAKLAAKKNISIEETSTL